MLSGWGALCHGKLEREVCWDFTTVVWFRKVEIVGIIQMRFKENISHMWRRFVYEMGFSLLQKVMERQKVDCGIWILAAPFCKM